MAPVDEDEDLLPLEDEESLSYPEWLLDEAPKNLSTTWQLID